MAAGEVVSVSSEELVNEKKEEEMPDSKNPRKKKKKYINQITQIVTLLNKFLSDVH